MRKQAYARRRRKKAVTNPARKTNMRQKQSRFPIGMETGYREGVRVGYDGFGTYFAGTSIIIPSYNQVHFLKKCIASIELHTSGSYEIIIVDNASTDGTEAYLRRLGSRVRYRVLETNRGFAGAVNVGMMMAKGSYLLMLNNDTIVTERWLDNMLACLNSDPAIGMVGPVSNYISGDQRIDVPYKTVKGIAPFARRHNIPNPAKWQRTDRLTGFCLLFRRELWDRTGYLDEGYTIGNFEDDDYNIRVRLQGYAMCIARDSFIHHFGSVSIKALGDKIAEVNNHNSQVYVEKWGNPHDLVHYTRQLSVPGGTEQGESAFFPQHVVARGISGTLYWVEGGVRRPIAGQVNVPVTRLSQVDIRRWPIGEPIAPELAEAGWHGIATDGSGLPSKQGVTAIGEDGLLYYVENGTRRRVASAKTAEAWGLQLKPQGLVPAEQLALLPEGLPIIAPVRVVEHL
ncbi:glycosyltransferase family 2 protein [Paenibacillus montanisoli]|uniref:Glycosyltransferase family 2 protein n=1 Tax=Paenibacillus montanisoli TaxID=2081970 RepID=A0A328UAV0_9BACL|nr:glycosyltransferase family 2 protein [Paenibacillus montanisoli]RAP77404.1 glycosyltransferase family 2 protein [Paenibacillus montanisoli]